MDTRHGRSSQPRRTFRRRARSPFPPRANRFRRAVSARDIVRTLQQVRQAQLSLRGRRRAPLAISGAKPSRQGTPDLCSESVAGPGSSGRRRVPGDATAPGRSFRTGVETLPGKERLTILRRLIAYAEKVFQLSNTVVAGVVDSRRQPRIPVSHVVKSVAVLFWTRMGSLNALELAAHSHFFR